MSGLVWYLAAIVTLYSAVRPALPAPKARQHHKHCQPGGLHWPEACCALCGLQGEFSILTLLEMLLPETADPLPFGFVSQYIFYSTRGQSWP